MLQAPSARWRVTRPVGKHHLHPFPAHPREKSRQVKDLRTRTRRLLEIRDCGEQRLRLCLEQRGMLAKEPLKLVRSY
jgi:hypothetical protein